MKELKITSIITIVIQIIIWLLVFIVDELPIINMSIRGTISMITSIILSLICIILYFKYHNKLINKYNLRNKLFNILLFIIWNTLSILIMFIFLKLIKDGTIHVCKSSDNFSCLLNGIEYMLFGFTYVLISVIILSVSMIIKLYKKIKE